MCNSTISGLNRCKNGLENVSKFTANDYRNIMKVMIFVIDNLYGNYKEGEIPCERLCEVFHNVYEDASGIIYRYVELPFEISIFEYSFVNHVQLDIRIWNLEIRMCHEIRIYS